MTIESIEQQLSATRDTLAKLEAELAALKKPAEVQYRPAEWPRDWGRTDAEFCDDGLSWKVSRIYGYDDSDDADNAPQFYAKDIDEWFYCCRVPVLPPDHAPGYREPVLPQDAGKPCEFSNDGINWTSGRFVRGYANNDRLPWLVSLDSSSDVVIRYKHARIRTGATA